MKLFVKMFSTIFIISNTYSNRSQKWSFTCGACHRFRFDTPNNRIFNSQIKEEFNLYSSATEHAHSDRENFFANVQHLTDRIEHHTIEKMATQNEIDKFTKTNFSTSIQWFTDSL